MKKGLIVLIVVCVAMLMVSGISYAAVSGACQGCHTMHDSQMGVTMTGTSWVNGALGGGALNNAGSIYGQLLRSNCVGCHSSAGTETLPVVMGQSIPIVRNIGASAPTTPLAGGNFYWVENAGFNDDHGHNVTTTDSTFTQAPGRQTGCSASCHYNLTVPTYSTYTGTSPYRLAAKRNPGCAGCHVQTFHHRVYGNDVATQNPTFRFLGSPTIHESAYVIGTDDSGATLGDSDWEYTNGAADHNIYRADPAIFNSPDVKPAGSRAYERAAGMSSFCSACHGIFHKNIEAAGDLAQDNWIRHPVDVTINDKGGEYTAYDFIGAYDPSVPVAFLSNTPSTANGVVFCLSCHRAHGSPNPSMLRWDYTTMVAGNGGAASGTGCFKCHSEKD